MIRKTYELTLSRGFRNCFGKEISFLGLPNIILASIERKFGVKKEDFYLEKIGYKESKNYDLEFIFHIVYKDEKKTLQKTNQHPNKLSKKK